MEGKYFGVQVPDQKSWNELAEKFDQYKEIRQSICEMVLGHRVEDPDYQIFNDMLDDEILRLTKLRVHIENSES